MLLAWQFAQHEDFGVYPRDEVEMLPCPDTRGPSQSWWVREEASSCRRATSAS